MDVEYLTVDDGCRLAYRFDGPADAPVVVLSNSLGTAMEMWAAQVPALTQRHRVLRYDTRGHGRSGVPAGAYSMDRLGRDVVGLIDGLGLEQVSFCGLSMGGMVGQWLGVRAPERLARLALCNTAAYMGPPSNWSARIDTVLASGMPAMVDAVIERWFTRPFRDTAPDAIAPVRAMLLATDPIGYAGACAAIRDMDQRPTAPLIKAPTLVIGGDHDPATPPATAVWLTEAIPGARLTMLEAAHLSNIEQAERFTATLVDFLG
ncbi:3-oxoadipate enol-lactonase [Pseudoxanthobacter soli DSM 19599]|uniref:3-oxoadipate enol-lactonase n=1 Tax=Pseudoxanthobacter soli DSM 19599 TaxID=1123029 RepID=A0A1M7ZRF3_9HYPH|nr:3-oxoadipate enol-lactonase [Pseudoxanthobacter soli]SHO67451.1 3-oxoadipate enol-lactonase [Pseudoxanthobacter soli DSM 19599]